VFFMTPAEVHSWKLSEDTDGFVLFFNASFYQLSAPAASSFQLPFFKLVNKVRHGELDARSLKEMETIAKAIAAENERPSAVQKNILRSYLDVLLYKLSASLQTDPGEKTNPLSVIPELQLLIEQHFLQHRHVSFYADRLNISTKQLNALAKNYLDKTVADVIRERMIAEAKRLLVYSSQTASEIAYELHFSDNSYFNRFFKKSEKITPEQFRKRFL